MLSSVDSQAKLNVSNKESSIISPNSKKLVIKRPGKITEKKRIKSKKNDCKGESKRKSSIKKNKSSKLLNILASPKVSSNKFQINVPIGRKNSGKVAGNYSNRSLKFSVSPKSSYVSPEEVEFPLKPGKVLNLFKNELTVYEQTEILKYSDIYYFGSLKNKIPVRLECENFGFDDSQTDYLLVKRDHIAYRYEILTLLGKGSFGQVCECFDHKKKEKVAVKVIKNKSKFHQQANIEIRVLQKMIENDPDDSKHIIRMKNYFSFRNHVCITFELISVNLYEFLKLNSFQGISPTLIRCFTKQILTALTYTRSLDIIHCDLKPENILLVNSQKALIKLIDFGSSCFTPERLHTYIQSRFYRAPEIILGIPYTTAIDMWSLGCILAELVTGYPLWPGESELDQLLHIIGTIGSPPAEVLAVSTRKSLFFDGNSVKTCKLMNGKVITPAGEPLSNVFKSVSSEFLDFIEKCLEWNPTIRLTPGEGLEHSWVKPKKASNKSIINKKTV
jgi:dual specificity tyrosine-phosphorylation-regulated kinase 2/3/4